MEDQLISWTYGLFGPLKVFIPKSVHDRLARDLYQSQNPYLPEEWFCYSLGMGVASFFLFLPLFYFLFMTAGNPAYTLPATVLFSLLVLTLLFSQPGMDRKRYTAEFEADMGLALLVLGIHLNTRIRFTEALDRVSAGFGHFSSSLTKTLKEVKAGTPLPSALDRMASSVDSTYVRRAMSALKNAYALTGPKGKPFTVLAEEMLKNNENVLREYSAKSGLLSQSSTIFTIVFPTLLISLLMISSVISHTSIPPLVLSLLIGFGFTSFAALLYQYQISTVPPFVRRLYKAKKMTEWQKDLDRKLRILGYAHSAQHHLVLAIFTLFCTFFTLLLLLPLIGHPGFIAPLLISSIASLIFFLRPSFQYSSLQTAMEDELPAILEQAAQFADRRTEGTLLLLSQLGCGHISTEFSKAHAEIAAGSSVEKAIRKISLDADSALIHRAMDLIIQAHKTGTSMSEAFSQTADYVRKIKFIMQESKAATFGERATQVFGFFISASLFGVVVSMGNSLGRLLSGGFFEVDLPLISAIEFGIQLNLLILPFVIAYNVSYLENDMKRVLFYLPLLLIVGNSLFFLTRQLTFI